MKNKFLLQLVILSISFIPFINAQDDQGPNQYKGDYKGTGTKAAGYVNNKESVVTEDINDLKNQQDVFQTDTTQLKVALTAGLPLGRWNEGLMFDGIAPMSHMVSAANWYPNTEDLLEDEIRIIFMGSSPMIRPGQANTSILIQFGNGKNLVFDIGEGSVANFVGAGLALNEINDIFLTHLHVDHYGALPYVYMFGAWNGRWNEPLRVTGPSGSEPKYGTAHMVEGMKMMTEWHRDAFDVFPIGRGWEIEVNEFDFTDDGGVVYDKDGIKVIHWQQAHCKDGASAYRVEYKGMSVVFSGDGRPNKLTAKYGKDADVLITEMQVEVVAISSQVYGVPAVLTRYTIDTHHNPAYAAGKLYSDANPRLAMATHTTDDLYANNEMVAEVREHYNGPFHFGFDGVVVNVTKDKIWVRDGQIPDYPNATPPQAGSQVAENGGMVVPVPRKKREDMQNQYIRDMQYKPEEYYPEGYQPELTYVWPSDKPIFVPIEKIPSSMKRRRTDFDKDGNFIKNRDYKLDNIEE
ncbi:guanitoxin biosynthesis MBL fold metallo-hydrolase GntH [Flammeovirga sp. OC4]|uniref:guanitoxin biosynthesis MBL fold metallo-hydrolase GntH n=1 Tax=Flammeovirga sp. OC4 TaxID=1382345 RepID=UPI0006934726|nr:guanitoxin biosynthesis MBL fold metallo-hydrolase GntH [Flammeovirga sp. OC4]